MPDPLSRELLAHLAQVREGLLETIAKFADADLAYVPFEGAYSVAQLMLHVGHEEAIELHWGLMRVLPEMPQAPDPSQYASVASIVEALGAVRARTLPHLEALSDGELVGEVETAWGQTMRRVDMVWHVMEHEVHHRAELSLVLGLLGRQGLDA
jgi:uncharacterized damage-inducible protein DinB